MPIITGTAVVDTAEGYLSSDIPSLTMDNGTGRQLKVVVCFTEWIYSLQNRNSDKVG